MKAIYLDSFKLHDINDSTMKLFVTTPVKGMEAPQFRVSQYNRSGEDGVYISNIFLGGRLITLEGYIFNVTSESDFVAQRQALMAALMPSKTSNNLLNKRILRVTGMDNVDYRVQCQITNIQMPFDNIRNSHFYIELLAHDVAIEAYTASSATVNTYTGGGAILPLVLPAAFSTGSGGDATVTNRGNFKAYPVITLNGQLTNPRIDNTTLGKYISLSLTINSGEYVTIDMNNRTIVQGGITNKISTKSSTSDWWWLDPGSNNIRLTSGVTGETGTATIAYRDTYAGL